MKVEAAPMKIWLSVQWTRFKWWVLRILGRSSTFTIEPLSDIDHYYVGWLLTPYSDGEVQGPYTIKRYDAETKTLTLYGPDDIL